MKSNDFLAEGIVEDAHEMHQDHEVQMAREECYHAAEDAISLHKLLKHVSEQQGLEGWVAAKITLSADYLKTVREYLEYQLMSGGEHQLSATPDVMTVAEGVITSKDFESVDEGEIYDLDKEYGAPAPKHKPRPHMPPQRPHHPDDPDFMDPDQRRLRADQARVKKAQDEYHAKKGVAEGEGNLGKALDTLSGNWSGWHQVKSRNPNIEKFEWDDGEGGFYADGSIEHNLKTGEVTVDYHGEYDNEVKGTFKNMGDAMRALRGDGGSHGGRAPNFDRLRDRKPPGPDDLRKTDRTGRKGTIGGGYANQLKGSIQANKGRLGPKGILPEQDMTEGLGYSQDPEQAKWYHEGRKAFKGGTTGNLIQDIAKKHGCPPEWLKAFHAGYQDQEGWGKNEVAESSAGSIAGVVNPTPKNKAKTGTLFGGTYQREEKTKEDLLVKKSKVVKRA